jgi:hypothetical protein
VKIDVTPEECALILDGLASLPLKASYNLFTKLMGEYQKQSTPSTPTAAEPVGAGLNSPD